MNDYIELYLIGFGEIENNFYEDTIKYDNEEFYFLEKNLKNMTEVYFDVFKPYADDDYVDSQIMKYLKILKVKVPKDEIIEYFINSSRYGDEDVRIQKLEVIEDLTDSFLQNIKVFA